MSVILSLDAMGGDHAPKIVVEGAFLALRENPSLQFLLFGNETVLQPLITSLQTKYKVPPYAFQIVHTDQVISNDAKGASALRSSRSSSLRLAIEAVASSKAAAVVSAGNTGAYMALSKVIFGTFPGIDRPAIAGILPTFKDRCAMLDLGANTECTDENLVQFAILGDSFARLLLGRSSPTIGLLNVGSEKSKGHALLQKTAQHLKDPALGLNFYGFVEGDDITAGTTDIVVTDGFSGNVALKAIEGTAKLIGKLLREKISTSMTGKIGYLIGRQAVKPIAQKLDPRLSNGAGFLGLNHIAVKSHGGTDSLGFANAIKVATDLVKRDFIGCLTQSLNKTQKNKEEGADEASSPSQNGA